MYPGYFALFHRTIAENNGLLAQMWKEYALSDSRYLTSDPFVVIMESITA
ncbi:5384_t:CDS:2, partial [Racocetra fulgida]